MLATAVLSSGSISVVDYRCSTGPAEAPYTELHADHSVAYVRRGSFGYQVREESFELVETIGDRASVWRAGRLPPLPELAVLGELAQAAAEGRSNIGLDEIGLLFASRFVDVVSGRERRPVSAGSHDRRRAVDAAQWLDAHAHEELDLESAAGVSPRAFRKVGRGDRRILQERIAASH